MNKLKTLIFSDLDGTLLDHFTYKSTAANETIQQLNSANIPVILNTSKTFAEVEIILDELQLTTPFIIENGAAVYIPIKTFETQPENTEVIDNYWVKSFSLPREYWLTLLSNNTGDFRQLYQGFSTLSETELCQLTGLNLADAKRAKQRQYAEPLHWLGGNEAKNTFIEHLMTLGANVIHGGRFIHVGDYCDKGQALTWLTEQYRQQFPSSSIKTIALGDGDNDIAMLEAADIAIQIRSPVHDFPTLCRQHESTKTTLYGPEGWAEAIQTYLANQLPSLNSGENHG